MRTVGCCLKIIARLCSLCASATLLFAINMWNNEKNLALECKLYISNNEAHVKCRLGQYSPVLARLCLTTKNLWVIYFEFLKGITIAACLNTLYCCKTWRLMTQANICNYVLATSKDNTSKDVLATNTSNQYLTN